MVARKKAARKRAARKAPPKKKAATKRPSVLRLKLQGALRNAMVEASRLKIQKRLDTLDD